MDVELIADIIAAHDHYYDSEQSLSFGCECGWEGPDIRDARGLLRSDIPPNREPFHILTFKESTHLWAAHVAAEIETQAMNWAAWFAAESAWRFERWREAECEHADARWRLLEAEEKLNRIRAVVDAATFGEATEPVVFIEAILDGEES